MILFNMLSFVSNGTEEGKVECASVEDVVDEAVDVVECIVGCVDWVYGLVDEVGTNFLL